MKVKVIKRGANREKSEPVNKPAAVKPANTNSFAEYVKTYAVNRQNRINERYIQALQFKVV